jgi:hypothetical protein
MPHLNESPIPGTADEDPDRQVEIADVTELTLFELLEARDKLVVDGVQQLVAEHHGHPVTASWSSFLDPGERPEEASDPS